MENPIYKRSLGVVMALAVVLPSIVTILESSDKILDNIVQKIQSISRYVAYICCTPPAPPAPPEPDRIYSDTVPSDCTSLTPSEWRRRFMLNKIDGTYHVFVASLLPSASKDKAEAAAEILRNTFKTFDFETAFTRGNQNMWTVVIAYGIQNPSTACKITKLAIQCKINQTAYAFQEGGTNLRCD
jgi:hypothetical protein